MGGWRIEVCEWKRKIKEMRWGRGRRWLRCLPDQGRKKRHGGHGKGERGGWEAATRRGLPRGLREPMDMAKGGGETGKGGRLGRRREETKRRRRRIGRLSGRGEAHSGHSARHA